MSDREIPPSEAALLLDKMIQESIPVVAFFVRDGVQVKLRGYVKRVSPSTGLEIIAQLDPHPRGYLVLPVGDLFGAGCKFGYGESREVDVTDQARKELNEKLGESVLLIHAPSGELRIFFNP